ncbi:MFS transporter [Actinomadura sp. 7K534]|uniref:MFS transporter n=1 Tax=Actinomadura sp. 7K534 TaxID=2530366 RepID=UPI001042DF0E|nr:MFS transporter [Actinomadura sp. 7K534]TDB91992.1 MFS transporter [Actinomadura sp. 7K534]
MDDTSPNGNAKLGRNFALLWSGSAISLAGAVNTTVAVPLIALSLTGSPFYAGLAGFAGAVARLLMQVPAGFIADRVDRRAVMVVAQCVRLCVALGLGVALWLGICDIWLLIAGVALEGIFAACFEITEFSVVPQLVWPQQLKAAVARNEGRNFLATLSGRPLGGALYAVGAGFPFLIAAGGTAVSVALIACLGRGRSWIAFHRRAKRESLRRQAREGWEYLSGDLLLRRTVVICSTTNFLFQIVGLNLVVLAEAHGLSPVHIGVLLAASGAGGLLGAWLAPRILDMAGEPGRTVKYCMLSWCAALGLIIFDVPVCWLVAWALVGFTGSHMNVMMKRHQAAVVGPERLGVVTGFTQFLTQGVVTPVALLAGGVMIAFFGPAAIAAGTAVLAAVLTVLIRLRGWHTLRWEDLTPGRDQPVGERPHAEPAVPLSGPEPDVSIGEWSSGSGLSPLSSLGRVLFSRSWRPSRPRPGANSPHAPKSGPKRQLVSAGNVIED